MTWNVKRKFNRFVLCELQFIADIVIVYYIQLSTRWLFLREAGNGLRRMLKMKRRMMLKKENAISEGGVHFLLSTLSLPLRSIRKPIAGVFWNTISMSVRFKRDRSIDDTCSRERIWETCISGTGSSSPDRTNVNSRTNRLRRAGGPLCRRTYISLSCCKTKQ